MINGKTKLSDLFSKNDSLCHYNENHGKDGKFISGPGSGGGGGSSNSKESKADKTAKVLKTSKEGVEGVEGNLSKIENIKGKSQYKKYDQLSDDELNKRISRLSREHQLSDLNGDTKYVKSGRDKAREALQTIGAVLTTALTGVLIWKAIKGDGSKKPKVPAKIS